MKKRTDKEIKKECFDMSIEMEKILREKFIELGELMADYERLMDSNINVANQKSITEGGLYWKSKIRNKLKYHLELLGRLFPVEEA